LKGIKKFKVEQKEDKTIIIFPVKLWTVFILAVFLLSFAASPFYFDNVGLMIICFVLGGLLFWRGLIFWLFRKVVIDKSNKKVVYTSFFGASFGFDEIISLECKEESGEYENYYLLIELKNGSVRIETQSDEQSRILQTYFTIAN